MKNKTQFIHIAAVFCFIVAVGLFAFSYVFAQNKESSEETLNSCVEWVNGYEQESLFEDVKTSTLAAKTIHFENLFAHSYEKPSLEIAAKFFPERAMSERDFLLMLQGYNELTKKQEAAWFTDLLSKTTAKKLTQGSAVRSTNSIFDLPSKAVLAEFRRAHLRGKWILRGEAARVLYQLASKALPESPELSLCKKWATDNAEAFDESFGQEEAVNTSTPPQPAAAPSPASSPAVSAPAASTPSPATEPASLGTTSPAIPPPPPAPITVISPNGGDTWGYFNYNIGYTTNGVSRVGFQHLNGSKVIYESTGPVAAGTSLSYSIHPDIPPAYKSGGDNRIRIFDWDNPKVYDESDSTFSLDVTRPVVSSIAASSITKNSAVITWTTDEPASGQINYGDKHPYWWITPHYSPLITEHSVTLSNLASAKKYFYRVLSTDALGNSAVENESTFTTAP